MNQEQQHLLMSVHGNLVKLKDFSQVTQNVIAEDMANEAIDDLMKLRDMLTSEKEGEYYLSDDEKQSYYHEEEKKRLANQLNDNE